MKIPVLLMGLLCLLACNSDTNSSAAGSAATDPSGLSRFEAEIEKMEAEDANRQAQANEILFIGSSSIRMWSSLQRDMAPMPVINRGFGGSTLPEVIHYADRIIFPYEPRLIVLYCGENDISEGATPQQVAKSFIRLDSMVQEKLPDSQMIYVSMKPSLARWNLWSQYQAGNLLIHQYIDKKPNRFYLESSVPMLLQQSPDSTIFIEDGLHMNEKGYRKWTAYIKPLVRKLYQSQTNN